MNKKETKTQELKEYCMQVDIANNIGTKKEIELYYENISFKTQFP